MKAKGKISKDLERISERLRKSLSEKDSARERCLKSCREIIRLSSTSIRAIHRREKEHASQQIASASLLVQQLHDELIKKHGDLINANFVHDAFKEYAEASITYGIIFERSLPDPDLLCVSYPAYLNGLAEAVGELRRYILDGLRSNEFAAAEELLGIMDHIYTILITMDFPDAITYGLRRTTDNVRGIVEKTRGDLTMVIHNNLLQQKLSKLDKKIGKSTY